MRKHFSIHFESESEVKVAQSCPALCNLMDYTVYGILQARILDCRPFPSPGTFSTLGLNPGLPHCMWILYQLSHKGSLRILEWVVYPFSSGSSQSSNRTRISCVAGRFLTSWATGKPQSNSLQLQVSPREASLKKKHHLKGLGLLWPWSLNLYSLGQIVQ